MSNPSSPIASRRRVLGLMSAGTAAGWTPGPAALADPTASTPTPACGARPTAADAEGPFFKPKSPERRDLAADGAQGVRLSFVGRVLDACGRPVAGALMDIWQADASGEYDLKGYGLRGHQYTDPDGGYRVRTIAPRWYAAGPGAPPPGTGRRRGPPRLDGMTGPADLGPPPPFGPRHEPGDLARRGPPPNGGLRTPHIHVKLQPPGGRLLTTQLFLPGDLTLYGRRLEPLNLEDGLYRPELRLALDWADDGQLVGRFDFVVASRN